MNYEKMAREILKFMRPATTNWTSTDPRDIRDLATKIKQLLRVPEDLEAAWRNVVPDVIDCLYSLHDPIAQGEVIGKAFTEAVASLLAERDERIELLETTIHLCSGSCRVDYKYPTPESPNED